MAKKKQSKFKSKVSQNTHKQQTQGSQYGYLNLPRGVNVFKEVPGGRIRLDFLPYEVTDPNHPDRDDDNEIATPGELWYKRPYYLHRNVGAGNDAAVCPSSLGKKCPICDYRARRMKEGASYQDDEIKALRASLRNLYVVVPLDSKDHDETPHIWDISQFLFQQKLNDEIEEDEANGAFPDPDEGLTLKIRFSEEKLGQNTFADTSRIDFEEREEGYGDETLDKVPNLDEVLSVMTYGQLEAKFFELEDEPEDEGESGPPFDPDDEDDEEENEPPKKSRRRKKSAEPASSKKSRRRKKAEPEEDDDDGDDEEEDDEDEMDKLQKEQDRDLGQEDDDDGDDEEEDEPPKKSRRRKKAEPEEDEGKSSAKKSSRRKKKDKEDDGDKCPHGHRFGVDTDEYDECDSCELWDECMDAMESAEGS
jgi:hypothetical protein